LGVGVAFLPFFVLGYSSALTNKGLISMYFDRLAKQTPVI
jgi:hypothetical protein